MKNMFMVFTSLLCVIPKVFRVGGMKALIAENLLLKQQLLLVTRSRKRAPNLSPLDRFLLGLWTIFLNPRRIQRTAILVQPSTLLRCHHALIKWKYRLLYASRKRGKPGPKGPARQLIELVLEMKRRNPRFGCPKIAEQISTTFAIPVDKDVVRRILAAHYHPDHTDGPSWLTFLGHMKDSLWSMDFFRCESLRLQTHWVLVVMDQCTRRIIGFGVHPAHGWESAVPPIPSGHQPTRVAPMA
jgi:hypothetical protein